MTTFKQRKTPTAVKKTNRFSLIIRQFITSHHFIEPMLPTEVPEDNDWHTVIVVKSISITDEAGERTYINVLDEAVAFYNHDRGYWESGGGQHTRIEIFGWDKIVRVEHYRGPVDDKGVENLAVSVLKSWKNEYMWALWKGENESAIRAIEKNCPVHLLPAGIDKEDVLNFCRK